MSAKEFAPQLRNCSKCAGTPVAGMCLPRAIAACERESQPAHQGTAPPQSVAHVVGHTAYGSARLEDAVIVSA